MALITAVNTHGDYGLTLTDTSGNSMQIDIPVEQGGTGTGMRPMQTVLAALVGCSTVDVVKILQKQRQQITSLKIEADGEREEGKEPSLWKEVRLRFVLDGNVDPSKAYRAAELSMNKYCSVAETLRRAGASIQFVVEVNGSVYNPQ